MDINATLFGQMITFAIFIWFTMKFIWPPVMKVLAERRQKIADGLAAAERGHSELEVAQVKAREIINEAKAQSASIIEQANVRSHHIEEQAKAKAIEIADRMKEMAESEIEQQMQEQRFALQDQVANLAVAGAEKLIKRNIDRDANQELLNNLVKNLVNNLVCPQNMS